MPILKGVQSFEGSLGFIHFFFIDPMAGPTLVLIYFY